MCAPFEFMNVFKANGMQCVCAFFSFTCYLGSLESILMVSGSPLQVYGVTTFFLVVLRRRRILLSNEYCN